MVLSLPVVRADLAVTKLRGFYRGFSCLVLIILVQRSDHFAPSLPLCLHQITIKGGFDVLNGENWASGLLKSLLES